MIGSACPGHGRYLGNLGCAGVCDRSGDPMHLLGQVAIQVLGCTCPLFARPPHQLTEPTGLVGPPGAPRPPHARSTPAPVFRPGSATAWCSGAAFAGENSALPCYLQTSACTCLVSIFMAGAEVADSALQLGGAGSHGPGHATCPNAGTWLGLGQRRRASTRRLRRRQRREAAVEPGARDSLPVAL